MENLFEDLRNSLPPIVARADVPRFLGSVISRGHLANLDSAGLGPEKVRIGKKVAYTRDSLIIWLIARSKSGESRNGVGADVRA